MHAARSIDIAASPATIYELAQDVARWPDLLPHYRYVKVLRDGVNERVILMAARRGWIPVKWTARERLYPATPRVEFTHLSGWTAGMEVAWTFEPMASGTRVTIVHDLDFRQLPFARDWIARRIIGDFFVQSIAGRTLARMKELAEQKAHG
jgi:aromatase